MRMGKLTILAGMAGVMLATSTAFALADTTVELKGVHLCCGACVKGVGAALKEVKGVTPKCDKDAGTVTISGESEEAVKKALAALGAAGYYGVSSNPALSIPAPEVPSGKVTSVKLTNAHNCCAGCCKAIKAAVKTASGVKADTATPKTANFEVTGDFNVADVVKALNAAGFQVQVNK